MVYLGGRVVVLIRSTCIYLEIDRGLYIWEYGGGRMHLMF